MIILRFDSITMHPRQRSPRGFYGSEYRHRGGGGVGFGRGYPSRRAAAAPAGGGGDVFMEAGRLAAEYLVSQGLLPPNVLSQKWHNNNGGGSFKKHGGGVGGGGEALVEGGRTSALARLGSAVSGPDGGRRKLGFEDFGQKGSRRRGGSFRSSNGVDWGRDYRRNASWSDRYRGAHDTKDDDDDRRSGSCDAGGGGGGGSGRQPDEEQHQPKDQQVGGASGSSGGDDHENVLQKSNSNEFEPRSEDGDDLEAAETDKDQVSGELLEVKQGSSGAEKDTDDMVVEFAKSSNGLENVSASVSEVKDGTGDDDNEKLNISKNLSAQSSDQENDSSSRDFTDLLSLCKSFKAPTRTRSSRTRKNLKADQHGNNEDNNTHDIEDLQEPEVLAENETVKSSSSSGDLISEQTYDLVHLDSDIVEVEPVHAAESTEEFDVASKDEEVPSIGSHPGQDRDYMDDKNQEPTATLPEYGSCSSMSEERGEKRVAEDDDVREETKRLREWLPSPVPKTEEYFMHNNPIEVKDSPGEDEILHADEVPVTSDHASLISSSQFTEGGDRPFFQCPEEKPSLPSSFRTCDLNLMEASEVHDNHVDHPVLIYPASVSETKKAVPVDIDLSMSRASLSGKFNTHSTSGKEIEVIDLENDEVENDSTPKEKSIDNMDTKYVCPSPQIFLFFMSALLNVLSFFSIVVFIRT